MNKAPPLQAAITVHARSLPPPQKSGQGSVTIPVRHRVPRPAPEGQNEAQSFYNNNLTIMYRQKIQLLCPARGAPAGPAPSGSSSQKAAAQQQSPQTPSQCVSDIALCPRIQSRHYHRNSRRRGLQVSASSATTGQVRVLQDRCWQITRE